MKSSPKEAVKGKYRRSTPVIRLRRNVDKVGRHAELCGDRLAAWRSAESPVVDGAIESVEKIRTEVGRLAELVDSLDRAGFVPPRRKPVWRPARGERVTVVDEYRSKYQEVYASVLKVDPGMLDDLAVVEQLPSGEVVVQRGRRTPFLVRKGHLARLPVECGP